MPSPRWRKVLRDLWQNKGRTLLVVLSIAVGVFAVGTVIHMQVIVRQDMIGSYHGASPANATIYVEDEFDDDLVQAVRDMPEVAEAEGRRSVLVRFQLDAESGWYPMILFAIPDYENIHINILQPEKEFGPAPDAWPGGPIPLPPPLHEVMLERTSCIIDRNGLVKAKLGDRVLFETPSGKQREMRLAGLVADFSQLPATNYLAYGYVTFDTMEWLGLPRTYSELVILVNGDRQDKAHVEQVAKKVADRMERGGVTVLRTEAPEPGQLPLDYMVDGLVYILGALGVLSLFSSAFLLINTVQALLSQQVRQIGVMKALGARNHQIAGMYLSVIVIYGVLALVIAVPLGTWIARWIVNFMTYFINFNLSSFGFPPQVLAAEVAMGLLVPLLAGLWPIIAGTRITIREAISSYGMGEGGFGTGFVDRLIEQVRGLPRPVLLSLRNTFRRKGRLALTLITMILAGAIFIAIVSVRASMERTVDEVFQFFSYDVNLGFGRDYRADRIERIALSVPGVTAVESWGGASTYRLRPDGSEGKSFSINAPPATTNMVHPTIVEGRWLRPGDQNALVLSTFLRQEEPDVNVGDEVVLKIEGRETAWHVVGIVRPPLADSVAYADYTFLTRLTRDAGQASSLVVVTEQHDAGFQSQIAEALETRFDDEGISVSYLTTVAEQREGIAVLFNILITLLMSMAILLASVGGIGLMGTMLLNVLERIREVGVMRAIGASTNAVIQIFVVEGVFIGVISWLLATILAWPLGQALSKAMGTQLPFGELVYTFSASGVAIWLGLTILLSIAASYLPAQNAAQITVREVLSYDG